MSSGEIKSQKITGVKKGWLNKENIYEKYEKRKRQMKGSIDWQNVERLTRKQVNHV